MDTREGYLEEWMRICDAGFLPGNAWPEPEDRFAAMVCAGFKLLRRELGLALLELLGVERAKASRPDTAGRVPVGRAQAADLAGSAHP